MKNILRISVLVIVIVSLALSTGAIIVLRGKDAPPSEKGEPLLSFVVPSDETPYLIKAYSDGSSYEGDFKILTFTDSHLNGQGSAGDAASLTVIENTILLEKPDLIVITGDIAVGAKSELAARRLAELFEKHNQYWGYALGNHDGENTAGPSRSQLVDIFGGYRHCIISRDSDTLSGEGNCIVNVKNGAGKVIQSLVFIDSGDYLKEDICRQYGFQYEEGEYDFIKYDQIEWYKSELNKIATKSGKMPNSIMFMHIPLKEYETAYNLAIRDAGTPDYGGRREPECDSPHNTGMFDAILELGSTKAVVCGHDHTNDYCVDYKGVKLLYSQSTSFNSYYLRSNAAYIALYKLTGKAEFNDGHTEFAVNAEGNLAITPKFNQNSPALFNGLTPEQRKELYLEDTLPPTGVSSVIIPNN